MTASTLPKHLLCLQPSMRAIGYASALLTPHSVQIRHVGTSNLHPFHGARMRITRAGEWLERVIEEWNITHVALVFPEPHVIKNHKNLQILMKRLENTIELFSIPFEFVVKNNLKDDAGRPRIPQGGEFYPPRRARFALAYLECLKLEFA